MNLRQIAQEITAAVDANPVGFLRRITLSARNDLNSYPGHLLEHIESFGDMPSAVDMLMKAFFDAVSKFYPIKQRTSVIDHILSDATFVRDWLPRYLPRFSQFLLPGVNQSAMMVSIINADASLRRQCVPESCFLLRPEEWTRDIVSMSASNCTLAAIPEAMLTDKLFEWHVKFQPLCEIALSRGYERAIVIQFLQKHANTYFMLEGFVGSSLCFEFLPFVKDFLSPSNLTKILRCTNALSANWNFFQEGVLPENYHEVKWWPMECLGVPKVGTKLRASRDLYRFQDMMEMLDWMVLPFFTKRRLNVDVMGRVASYLFIDDFASRVRIFFKKSHELIDTYVERCIRPAKRVRL